MPAIKKAEGGELTKEVTTHLKKIKSLEAKVSPVQEEIQKEKEKVEAMLNGSGFTCDFVKVSYSKGTAPDQTLDVVALKEAEPNLYAELLADYPKEKAGRKPSYRYTFAK